MATLADEQVETGMAGPVRSSERILALDVLRGFAMAGVLVAFTMWSLGTRPESEFTPLDRLLAAAAGFAVDGKFYTILAFLFGLGFHLQLRRRAGAETETARLYRRRLLVLAAIGLIHAVLLRNGDILLPYALMGLLLVPFRDAAGRTILAAALLALLFPLVAQPWWEAGGLPLPDRPQTEGMGLLASNLAWLRYWYGTAIFNWPPILTLFLIGFLAGRHHWLRRLADRPQLAKAVAGAGLAGGAGFYLLRLDLLESAVFADRPDLAQATGSLLFTAHAWSLAAAYVSMLLLALRSSDGERALRPLAAVGRMALTNYLLQAGLIVPLCLVFGWFDRFTPSSSLLLAFAIFLIQVPASQIWLRRFEFGPAEWLWRRLTYGRLPMLAEARPAAP